MKLLVSAVIVFLLATPLVWAEVPTREELAANDLRIIEGLQELAQQSRGNDLRLIECVLELLRQSRANDLRTVQDVTTLAVKVNKVREAAIDSQARKIANRALAGMVRVSVVTPEGAYPDIEEVEKMLSSIVVGNMSPLPFETRLAEAVQAKGWTILERPGRDGEVDTAALKSEILAAVLAELEPRVNELTEGLRQARDDARGAADEAKAAAKESKEARMRALEHETNAQEAATVAQQEATQVRDMSLELAEGKYVTQEELQQAIAGIQVVAPGVEPGIGQRVVNLEVQVTKNTSSLGKLSDAVALYLGKQDGLVQEMAKTYLAILELNCTSHAITRERLRGLGWTDPQIEEVSRVVLQMLYGILLNRYGDHLMVQTYFRANWFPDPMIEEAALQYGSPLVYPEP